MEFAFATIVANLANGHVALTDVGTVAVLGGVLGEVIARFGRSFGAWTRVDGWREGMFMGALVAVLLWFFDQVAVVVAISAGLLGFGTRLFAYVAVVVLVVVMMIGAAIEDGLRSRRRGRLR